MNHFIGRIVAGTLLAVLTMALSAHAQAATNPSQNNQDQNNQDKKPRTEQADQNKNQAPTSPIQQRDLQQAPRKPNNPSPLNPNMQNTPTQKDANAPPAQDSTVLPGERHPRALSQPPANPQGGNQSGNDRSLSNRNNQNRNNQSLSNRPSSQPSGSGNQFARRESTTARERTAMRPTDMRGPDIGLWFNRGNRDGLVISDVSTRGPIARLGFRESDRIVSVDGRRVANEADFINFLLNSNADRVEVVVSRDGRDETIYVEPNTLVEDYGYTEVDPIEQFGIVLDDRYDNRIVVWRVIPRSPAYYAGLREGDIVTSLSGRPYTSRRDFETGVRDLRSGEANLKVRRGDRDRDLTVDVPEFEKGAGSAEQGAGSGETDRNDQMSRDQPNQRDNNDRSNNDRANNDRNSNDRNDNDRNNPRSGNQNPPNMTGGNPGSGTGGERRENR
jgi:hypothetical protein